MLVGDSIRFPKDLPPSVFCRVFGCKHGTDKPFNRTSRSIDLSNRPRTPSEPWISRPWGGFTMKRRRRPAGKMRAKSATGINSYSGRVVQVGIGSGCRSVG